jgi:uncharacterized membrane protein YbhN (UPF0104 family)
VTRTVWRWGRIVGPILTLAVLVWRLGTGPFLNGLGTIDGGALTAAAAITALATLCSAWRWKTVAQGLGVDLPVPVAVAAYYRSMFLNVTLPGGIIGDVHRGVSHGRDAGDIGRGLRAVAWERFAGQVVQAIVTVVVLAALPSPVRSSMPLLALAVAVVLGSAVLVGRALPEGRSAWARFRSATGRDIRDAFLTRRAWLDIVLASALVVACHTVTFLLAARTAGSTASIFQLLPLALLAIVAMVMPSVAGWGPREGVTAWAFGAAGLGVQQGVATAVVYGVMVLVASLPGAVVLVVEWFRGTRLPVRNAPGLREGAADA